MFKIMENWKIVNWEDVENKKCFGDIKVVDKYQIGTNKKRYLCAHLRTNLSSLCIPFLP